MNFTIANAKKSTLSSKPQENKYTIKDYSIDLKNPNDSHSILINAALGSKQILDVGCGVGYIGRILKEHQKCTVDGIDIDETALKIAAKYYDHTTLMKIGDQKDKAFINFLNDKNHYDCIICGDLIEHLADPGYVISILAKKLTKTGKLLISIPNIAHIDVIAGLIDGKFNYAKTGILDSTHLRFWTESSFYDFIKNVSDTYNISLSPKRIARTIVEHPILDTRYFREICGDEIFTFQNIFELKPSKTPTIPRLKELHNYHDIIVAIDSRLEVELLKAKLAEKDKIIQNYESSFSWKLTKPLRKLKAIISKH